MHDLLYMLVAFCFFVAGTNVNVHTIDIDIRTFVAQASVQNRPMATSLYYESELTYHH